MKHIQKSPEPRELSTWKQVQLQNAPENYHYKYLQNPEKRLVHQSLLTEQGYICCYCCNEIDRDSSHIEHLEPQSQTDADLSLDYNNILASCNGSKERKKGKTYCGNQKGDRQIEVSPLDPDCESYFAYNARGKIAARSGNVERDKLVKQTIEVLNLKHDDLCQERAGVYVALRKILSGKTPTEVQILAKRYRQRKGDRYRPFSNAASYYLRKYWRV